MSVWVVTKMRVVSCNALDLGLHALGSWVQVYFPASLSTGADAAALTACDRSDAM